MCALGFVYFVNVVVHIAPALAVGGQEPSDAELEAAGADRTVRVRLGPPGAQRIIDIPVELYVARVLAGEGEANAGDAAQQALAIAIRTFAAANGGRHRRDGFDLCDTTHCQVLRPTTPTSRRAAMATVGQMLMYDGRPAEVFYSASCGGRSEAVSHVWPGGLDRPYLASVEDDVHGGEEPWEVDVPSARIERALRQAGFEGRRLDDLRVARRSESGRVSLLHLSGMRPDAIAGDDFRLAIGVQEVRSTAFTVKKIASVFRFTGRGYGHGVGLCVLGAGRRAARGETAAAILQQYYPGLTVQSSGPTSLQSWRPTSLQSWGPTSVGPVAPLHPAPEHIARVALSTDATRIALRARDELVVVLGLMAAPSFTVAVHDSLDSFRHATGRPWWVTTSVHGSTIEVAPLAILEQRDGVEPAIRRAVAESLVSGSLADRPAWVRVGAARYFAAPPGAARSKKVKCPTDAELQMAVSASAHRDAELRAEACFAAGFEKIGDWRAVR